MFYRLYFILCSVGMKRWMEILGSAVCFTSEKYGGKWRGQDVFYPTHQIQSYQIGEKSGMKIRTPKNIDDFAIYPFQTYLSISTSMTQ